MIKTRKITPKAIGKINVMIVGLSVAKIKISETIKSIAKHNNQINNDDKQSLWEKVDFIGPPSLFR